jgi:hypothetical protein
MSPPGQRILTACRFPYALPRFLPVRSWGGIVKGRAWSVAAVGAVVAVLGGCTASGDTTGSGCCLADARSQPLPGATSTAPTKSTEPRTERTPGPPPRHIARNAVRPLAWMPARKSGQRSAPNRRRTGAGPATRTQRPSPCGQRAVGRHNASSGRSRSTRRWPCPSADPTPWPLIVQDTAASTNLRESFGTWPAVGREPVGGDRVTRRRHRGPRDGRR